jgi:hypothetical protein
MKERLWESTDLGRYSKIRAEPLLYPSNGPVPLWIYRRAEPMLVIAISIDRARSNQNQGTATIHTPSK